MAIQPPWSAFAVPEASGVSGRLLLLENSPARSSEAPDPSLRCRVIVRALPVALAVIGTAKPVPCQALVLDDSTVSWPASRCEVLVMVQVTLVGATSRLPAASRLRMSTVWVPGASELYETIGHWPSVL